MAKITRATQTIFGGTGITSDFGEFGSLAAGTPTTTKNPATIQFLAAWGLGWAQATIGALIPAYQDMNSVHYLAFYQICYLLQMGIAEWDSGTTYYTDSIVQYNSVLYQSLIDTNLNNEPDTSPSDWLCISPNAFGGNVASTSSMMLPNTGNSFKVTGTTNINNIVSEPAGIIVVLIFEGILTVNTGGNILLTNGAFTTISNATLMLISDGTDWFEISRSPENAIVGVPVSKTIGSLYGPTATAGFVNASGSTTENSGDWIVEGNIGPTNSLGTIIVNPEGNSNNNQNPNFAIGFYVPKGWYYIVSATNASINNIMFFTPIGT